MSTSNETHHVQRREINPWIPTLVGPVITLLLAGLGLAYYMGQQDAANKVFDEKLGNIVKIVPQINALATDVSTLTLQYETLNKSVEKLQESNDIMSQDVLRVKFQINAMTGEQKWQK